ncbi:U5 small nuclear ribonucleoprotein TSSC4 [Pyxicephalus adspersus]|uniref:U5 small nuclear ribonucleoprotein TSSC4 n=1 Tax=Pyxicephalus adspersus TaxID=30357 RepID=A0AAV2ZS03_PYXAD|nr:TPA: hypothetical protein GDO54_002794 [Pyxicephalus adspersus]
MSESPEKDDTPEPFSALSFESPQDPGTLSLSDSDPALSDHAEVESVSAEEEDNDDEDNAQDHRHESPLQPFTLKGTDVGFSQRSHGIFGGLLDVQKCSSLSQFTIKGKQGASDSLDLEVPASNLPEQKEKSNTGSTNVTTKKRSAPASRLPDYLAHPERWTKYNLEDVPDTSDRTNRNTALSFLLELKHKKEDKDVLKNTTNPLPYNQDSSSSGEGRILFTKPQKKSQKDSEKSETQAEQQHVSGSWGDEGLDEAEGYGEQARSDSLGFHMVKKRSRKNIRPKADDKEEEDSS